MACHYEELWTKLGPINVLTCVDEKEGLVWFYRYYVCNSDIGQSFVLFNLTFIRKAFQAGKKENVGIPLFVWSMLGVSK